MRKIFAASALGLLLLSGCASLDSGKITDKVRQTGNQEYDCDTKTTGTGKNKTTKRVCEFEQRPDVCSFQLDDGKERGWLQVDCGNEYDAYQVGEQYPR
jgi:hypothetical protein